MPIDYILYLQILRRSFPSTKISERRLNGRIVTPEDGELNLLGARFVFIQVTGVSDRLSVTDKTNRMVQVVSYISRFANYS